MNASDPLWSALAVAASAFLVGIAKGGGGLGSMAGLFVTPVLLLVMPARAAVGFALPLLIVGDFFTLWAYWRRWESEVFFRLLPGMVGGLVLGSLLLGRLDSTTLQHGIGAFVLTLCGYRLVEARLRSRFERQQSSRWTPVLYSGVSAFASALSNAGGPIINLYLITQRLSPLVFNATSGLYFAVLNALKVPGFLLSNVLDLPLVGRYAWAVALVPLGVWLGYTITQRLDARAFNRLILALLALTGAYLVLR